MEIMGTTLEPFKNFGGVSANVNKLISGFNLRIFRKFEETLEKFAKYGYWGGGGSVLPEFVLTASFTPTVNAISAQRVLISKYFITGIRKP
jgi:hypothetical protein